MLLKYVVEKKDMMVKEYLEYLGLSRNVRKKIKSQDLIFVNGEKVKNYHLLQVGDLLEIKIKEKINQEIPLSDNHLNIVYEDDDFLIIVKEKRISSQPSRKHLYDNIISILKNYFLRNNIEGNIHVVTRLDYDTTGLMIIAKHGLIHYMLSKTIITKEYLCEITGCITPRAGTISLPIARHLPPDIRRYVDNSGKMAITHYQTIKEMVVSSLVKVRLETGRTHQIRVHFAYLNHPLIGDSLYGQKKEELRLHCFHLSFIHPMKKELINIYHYPVWYQGGKDDA